MKERLWWRHLVGLAALVFELLWGNR